MIQRPPNFRLNPKSPLYKGLVFAGLGRAPGGKYLHDSSPRGNRGTLTNMDPASDHVWVPELGRWGLEHDGIDDYVLVPSNCGIIGDYTFAAWIRLDQIRNYGMFFTKANSAVSGPSDIELYSNASGDINLAHNRGSGDFGYLQWFGLLSIGVWTHVSATYIVASNTGALYVNGTPRTFDLDTLYYTLAPNASYQVYLGATPYTDIFEAANELDGQEADVCLWSRALGGHEIKILADRSDPFLGGLILPPRRRLWGAVSVTTNRRRRILLGAAA